MSVKHRQLLRICQEGRREAVVFVLTEDKVDRDDVAEQHVRVVGKDCMWGESDYMRDVKKNKEPGDFCY